MMNSSAHALFDLRRIRNAALRLSLAGALLSCGCDHVDGTLESYRRAQPSAKKLSPLGTRCPDPVAPPPADAGDGEQALARINHFVVIYLENHSFDSLYGLFPGADGLLDDDCELTTPLQVDKTGTPYRTLPSVAGYPTLDGLPNQPFLMDARVPPHLIPPNLAHAFYSQQAQINGGQMDQFVAFANQSDALGATLAYYDTAKVPLAKLAAKFTLCDQFFQSAFGGSFLNHIWLIAARTPYAPSLIIPGSPPEVGNGKPYPVDANGDFTGSDPQTTYDGFAINTMQPQNFPHYPESPLLPSLTDPTIGDRLSEKGVSWAWYSGGWREITEAGAPQGLFQYHHQPFVYFENFKEGTAARAEHLKDELDFLNDAKNGTLPAVSFLKPHGSVNEHPGYTNLSDGEDYTVRMVEAVMSSPNWADTAIIITYDENGGFADHVAPPIIDRWGPGTRVPAIVISNYAKKGYVDHTQYETVSILATIEHRFGLSPLSPRDANANDLTRALTLSE